MSYRNAFVTAAPRRSSHTRTAKKAWFLMCAVAPVAALLVNTPIHAATLTWDPLQTTTGSDGTGLWDTTVPTNTVWATGTSDVIWPDAGTTATFGDNGTAGTVTIDDATVSAGGLTFGTTASGSNYTIAATTTNTLTLTGAGATINVATGEAPTISAPIAGTVGLTLNNGTTTGTLTLAGVNTYTGTTAINSGTLIVAAGSNLGANANPLIIGTPSTTSTTVSPTTTVGNLVLNSNVTVGTLTVATNNTAANPNTLAINGTSVLTVTGATTIGLTTAATTAPIIALNVSGNELDLNGSLTVGLSDTGARDTTNFNLANLSTFEMNAPTGALNFGTIMDAGGTITLANVSNTITVATLAISATTSNAGTDTLILGNGTNVINASTINIGTGKGTGIVQFGAAATGSVTIGGTTAGSATNITLADETSATASSTQSNLSLANHTATVNANTVIIGELNGATSSTATAAITFDTGTFNAVSLSIADDIAGGNATVTQGSKGTLTLGGPTPNTTATGVLNVSSSFVLATDTNTTANSIATGTFIINGGTANVSANITVVNTHAIAATLTLADGTLNMNGFAIGTATAPITTVALAPTAGDAPTLSNLGGTGINGAGLLLNGLGNLTLTGANTYSGGTTINPSAGLQVGTPSTNGTLPAAGAIVNNGSLTFFGSNANAISGSLSGAGSIFQSGTGNTTFSGSNTFTGPITITAGALILTGTNSSSSSTTVGGGVLAGNGTTGDVILASGSIHPGTTAADGSVGTLTIAGNTGLTVNGGDIRVDATGSGDQLIVTNTAAFTAPSTITVAPGAATGVYTILTAGTLTLTVVPTLTVTAVGRSTFALDFSTPNAIKLDVTGGVGILVWTGATSSAWDIQTTPNFLNTATASADIFYNNDNVTFDDTASNPNVTIPTGTAVAPGKLTFTNNSLNYTISGGGKITGVAGLTKSGNATLTLQTVNDFTGDTVINAGKLDIGASGGIASANVSIASGATLAVEAGGQLSNATNLTNNGQATFNNPTRSLATLNGAGNVTLNSTNLIVTAGGTFSGSINDGSTPGSLTASGGTLILTGTNNYSGNTTVTAGTLQVGNGTTSGTLGTGPIVISGGALAFDRSDTVTLASAITGTGALQQIGSGKLLLTGANAYGATNIAAGTLQVGNGGTGSLGAGPVTNAASLVLDLGSNATVSNAISGNGSLLANGTAILTLSGVSTYTGVSTLAAGQTVLVTNGAALGGAAGALNVNSGATLDLGGATAANTLAFGTKVINIAGSGVAGIGAISDSGILSQTGAISKLNLTADATISSSGRWDFRNNTATLNLNGFNLHTRGSGQITLVATAVSSGNIFVDAGTFAIETSTTFAGGATGGSITYAPNTVAEFYTNPAGNVIWPITLGENTTVGAGNTGVADVSSNILLAGNVSLTPLANDVPTPTANSPLALLGNISDNGTPFTLTKNGVNTVNLSGTNTYTGNTIVNGGTLLLANSAGSATGSGNVILNSGTLAGTASVAGTVIAGSGPHTISPGAAANSVGTLTLGGLTTNANTTLAFDLFSPISQNDLIAAGNLTLNGGNIAVTSQSVTGSGSLGYYKVLSYTSLTGTTAGITLPAVVNNVAYTLDTTHDSGFVDLHRGFIGDADDSGTVDVTDLNTVLANLGTTNSSWTAGNFDGAPTIDLTDLDDVLNNLGMTIPGTAETAPGIPAGAPEPATLTLGALTFSALLLRRKRNFN
jgi:fibronectin-binding autotransporter adhesin